MVMGSMRGFDRGACVTLFFTSWELTSQARLISAAILVLCLSVGYEKLRQAERELYLPSASFSEVRTACLRVIMLVSV